MREGSREMNGERGKKEFSFDDLLEILKGMFAAEAKISKDFKSETKDKLKMMADIFDSHLRKIDRLHPQDAYQVLINLNHIVDLNKLSRLFSGSEDKRSTASEQEMIDIAEEVIKAVEQNERFMEKYGYLPA